MAWQLFNGRAISLSWLVWALLWPSQQHTHIPCDKGGRGMCSKVRRKWNQKMTRAPIRTAYIESVCWIHIRPIAYAMMAASSEISFIRDLVYTSFSFLRWETSKNSSSCQTRGIYNKEFDSPFVIWFPSLFFSPGWDSINETDGPLAAVTRECSIGLGCPPSRAAKLYRCDIFSLSQDSPDRSSPILSSLSVCAYVHIHPDL